MPGDGERAVCYCAGILGVDPTPFTLRRLVAMASARVEFSTQKIQADWQRTSSLLALIANVHRDPKKTKAFKPDDLNPMAPRRKESADIPVGIEALKVFVR